MRVARSTKRWVFLGAVLVLGMGLESCDKNESSGEKGGAANADQMNAPWWNPRPGFGCIQGAVIDAFTGEKIDLATNGQTIGASDGAPVTRRTITESVFALIRGQKLDAMLVADHRNPLLKGEYFICDVPIEQDYLLFAHVGDYLPFQSATKIESTVAQRSARAVEDIVKPDPIALANICLFPKGAETKDLAVKVYNQGKPVKDAIVRLKPSYSDNALAMPDLGGDGAGFGCLTPSDSRLAALRATTNDQGIASFGAKELVLGAVYTPYVIPTGKDHLQPLVGTPFALGVNHANFGHAKDLYEVVIDLDTARLPLELVSCSNSVVDHSDGGELRLVFNQEFRLVDVDNVLQADVLIDCENESRGPDSGADPFCSLANVDLRDDIPGNGQSEAIQFSISGNTLTLRPLWRAGVAPSQTVDPGLFVTYPFDKIKLRVPLEQQGIDLSTVSISSLNAIGCDPKVYFYPYQ